MVERVHDDTTSIIQYNDENSLSCVISLAYYCALDFYEISRERHAGKGFADLVFTPLMNHLDKPAIVFELKWGKSTGTAMKQIEKKQYPEVLRNY